MSLFSAIEILDPGIKVCLISEGRWLIVDSSEDTVEI